MRISRAVLDAVIAEAAAARDRECCGLLMGPANGDTIDAYIGAANLAPDPTRHFEIDPAILLAAHKARRAGGPAILGHYHSHPGGDPTPSREDALQADPAGQLWLICGAGGQLSLWRAVTGGAVHNRFDPVEIIV